VSSKLARRGAEEDLGNHSGPVGSGSGSSSSCSFSSLGIVNGPILVAKTAERAALTGNGPTCVSPDS